MQSRSTGNHKQLIAWQKAVGLAISVHEITAKFPKSELFGLTAQIRRAAVSIPSNIAEGAARGSSKDFLRFMYIASGSCAELETQLHIARAVGYAENSSTIEKRLVEVGKLLSAIIRTLRNQITSPQP